MESDILNRKIIYYSPSVMTTKENFNMSAQIGYCAKYGTEYVQSLDLSKTTGVTYGYLPKKEDAFVGIPSQGINVAFCFNILALEYTQGHQKELKKIIKEGRLLMLTFNKGILEEINMNQKWIKSMESVEKVVGLNSNGTAAKIFPESDNILVRPLVNKSYKQLVAQVLKLYA